MRRIIAMLLVVVMLFGMMPSASAEETPSADVTVTETPATEAPATEPPVTEAPATEPPATEAPATEPPVTEAPVTEPAETEAPATEPPATEAPATEPPATEAPATEPAETEPPVTETPATEPVITVEETLPEAPADNQASGAAAAEEDLTADTEEEETLEPAADLSEEGAEIMAPGGVQQPSERYYHADHKFGFDSMTSGGTVTGATVSVGGAALTEGNASSTNAAALASGVTITFQPGYYLHSYKIVCGDKYSCNTAAQGMAVSVTNVMSGATQASYTVTLTKTALGHSSEKGPYWILLDIRQDDVKYKVTYNWGILEGQLTNAAPATETHLVNEVVTVKEGDADAIAQAKTMGYRFLGWSNSIDGNLYQPDAQFGMPAKDVVLTALWEKIPEDTLNPGTGSVVIPFTKSWDDNDNEHGLRPESLTVRLYKFVEGGEKILVEEKTVTAETGWACSFDISGTALQDENGNNYQFAIEEVLPENYTESVHTDPEVIFNPAVNGGWQRITPCSELSITTSGDYKSIVITKKGNQYIVWTVEALTQSERQMLFESAVKSISGMGGAQFANATFISGVNGYYGGMTVTPGSVQFSASENWSFLATGYYQRSSVSSNSCAITNKLNPQVVTLSGEKVWDDAGNQDGIRPESVTIHILADGEVVQTLTVTAETGWKWSVENLPKYAAGQEIVYTVTEEPVEGYTAAIDGFTVTNTHTPEVIAVSGEKTWNDGNNQDGIRPASITVRLFADGTEVATATVNAEDGWKWSFEGLPKFAAGEEIVYTITEDAVDGYTAVVDGYNVTNTHSPETVDISGGKTWADGNDQDGLRPESITVRLLADGEEVDSVTVSEANGWTWHFENLPTYAAGQEITYTITEDAVDGYTGVVDGYSITNTHVPETIAVSGEKTWVDGNDQDGLRPESITVNLLADGVKIDSVTVTAEDGWKWSFEGLPKFASGKEIEYTVSEEAVEGYTAAVEGYNITNTHTPEEVTVSGRKTWDDENNRDNVRPASITVILFADNVKVDSVTVTAEDGWAWSFEDLPKYAAGQEIVYTVSETPVAGYTAKVEGFNITNTHTPETINLSGAKTWVDADNQDGIRPASITVRLYADGTEVAVKTVTAEDGWAWSFENLPKYREGKVGEAIVYTVTEDAVTGYTAVIDGMNVTNTHAPEMINISGTKTWDDADNQDGIRPDTITIHLMANGEKIDSVTVTAAEGWKWSFENLPRFAAGQEIRYTISEESVDGYETLVKDFDVTNVHVPETVTVEGAKTWVDSDDRDGLRPESITIRLLADGKEVAVKEVTAEDEWKWSFPSLPKNAAGTAIVYTVTEDPVEGYETAVAGYNITNTHVPETVTVEGSKTWQDGNDQDGIRPDSITVNLLANGEKAQTLVVTAEDGWKWSFTELPKYSGGERIIYTVEEVAVEGYTTTVVGYSLINVHIPEKITVSGTKTWVDGDDQDGLRPDTITVNLLADGVKIDTVTVRAPLFGGGWKFEFKNLPKYAGGKEIVYTVEEEPVEGYTTKVEGFNITNTHEPEETERTVKKVWNDKNDENKKRPTKVVVTLYANGKSTGKSLTLSAANSWTGMFKDLPKYADGKEINYTLREETVAYYKDTYSYKDTTITVTNTYSDIPRTGDETYIFTHLTLMTISSAALVVLAVISKRRFFA